MHTIYSKINCSSYYTINTAGHIEMDDLLKILKEGADLIERNRKDKRNIFINRFLSELNLTVKALA